MHFQIEGENFTDVLRETALYADEHDSLVKAQDCLGEGYTEEMHLRAPITPRRLCPHSLASPVTVGA